MTIHNQTIQNYKEEGYILQRGLIDRHVIEAAIEHIEKFDTTHPGTVSEEEQKAIRALNISDYRSDEFDAIANCSAITDMVYAILSASHYVYQFKINLKRPFHGDAWRWHQDFIFWHKEDGMQRPEAVTVAIFLDDVTELNGPLFIVPRSHLTGMIDVTVDEGSENAAWQDNFRLKLKYELPDIAVEEMVAANGIVSAKGPAGTALFFDPNLVHASAQNLSPFQRRIMFITFNSKENVPTELSRPEFLVSRPRN